LRFSGLGAIPFELYHKTSHARSAQHAGCACCRINRSTRMTPDQFAEALSQLFGKAEDAGMPSDLIAAELGAMAEAMRQCMEE
jgi:hypothetical protein